MTQLALTLSLAPYARFSTWVAGGNVPAFNHLTALVRGEAGELLWLWGPPACGKSHLLQAACAAADDRGERAMYVPLAAALEDPELLHGLDQVDLLALDDVGRVAGRAAWERSLFGLLTAVAVPNVVMAAHEPPAAVPFALADLASRARAAIVYRLAPLDDAERMLALKRHARHRGLELDDAAARYLLTRVERDMSAVCEWLEHLDRASLAAQRKLTVPFIRAALAGRPTF